MIAVSLLASQANSIKLKFILSQNGLQRTPSLDLTLQWSWYIFLYKHFQSSQACKITAMNNNTNKFTLIIQYLHGSTTCIYNTI